MTFLAAYLRSGGRVDAADTCDVMLKAQRAPLHREGGAESDIAIAAAVQPILAGGDRSAFGPSPCGEWLVAIDGRLTDRESLARRLGVPSTSSRTLVLEAWSRWGVSTPTHLQGNFAIIAWHRPSRQLHLVRDQLGQRPLFYRTVPGGFAAASMPAGLLQPFEALARPDLAKLKKLLRHSLELDSASFHEGIWRVRPGESVVLSLGGSPTSNFHWRPETAPDFSLTTERCADVFADLLPAAVADQVERERKTGFYLSAGLDSSAVAAWAAQLRHSPDQMIAVTAVPATDALLSAPPGRIANEEPLARIVAAAIGIDHQVVSPERGFASSLDDAHAIFAQPMPNAHNHGWSVAAMNRLQANKVTVALNGQAGNLTFSMDGERSVREALREGSWAEVARRVLDPFRAAARLGRWSRRLASLGQADAGEASWTLARDLTTLDAAKVPAREHGLALLRAMDPGPLLRSFYMHWGIDLRDPTADLRLVEFALRIPTVALRSGALDRAPARLALRGVVPDAVRLNKIRGYQAADWLSQMQSERAIIVREVEALAASSVARELIDVRRLQRLVSDLPTSTRYDPKIERLYRHVVPQAITVAGWARRVAGE